MAAARPCSSASSRSLTAIRRAWNTRVAAWVRRRTRGFGGERRSMSAASSSAVSTGAVARAATIALAYFQAEGSSPYLRNSAASSSAERVARSSEAGTPRLVSTRMSSGPPARKPKPRSRSASWKELRPRSNRSPSTRPNPASGATSPSSRKFDRRSTRRSPTRASRARTRSIASSSASSPRTRPSGLAASRIRSVCPPPPTVASIWRLPGRGDRVSRTSPAITGRCPSSITPPSVGCGSRADPGSACGATSDPQPGDGVGERLAFQPAAVVLPASGRPDLGVVARAEDERLAIETGERPQVLRDEDTTLSVELRLERAGEQLPLEETGVRVGHGQAADPRRQLVPGLRGKDREAGVEPPRDDHVPGELGTEAGRDGQAPLLVARGPLLPGKHRSRHS